MLNMPQKLKFIFDSAIGVCSIYMLIVIRHFKKTTIMKRIYIFLSGLLILSSCKIIKYDYALISDRDDNLDLYISSKKDQLLNITNDKFTDYGIKWSPDGNFILFAKQVNKQYDLYLYNIGLKTTEQLTNDTINQYGPSFSPDGKRFCLYQMLTTSKTKFI